MKLPEHGPLHAFFVAIMFCAAMTSASCQSSSSNHSKNSENSNNPPLAVIRRSGGLLFNDDRVYVYPNGDFTVEHLINNQPQKTTRAKLPTTVLRNFTTALQATSSLNAVYSFAPGSADMYQYALLYNGRTTTWSDASPDVPKALSQISNLFNGVFLTIAE